jgi:hypothetical protein
MHWQRAVLVLSRLQLKFWVLLQGATVTVTVTMTRSTTRGPVRAGASASAMKQCAIMMLRVCTRLNF